MDIQHPEEIWLISVLAEFATDEQWNKICLATTNISINVKITVPNFKFHARPHLLALVTDLQGLMEHVSDLLKHLVEFSVTIGEKPSYLWENLSVFNGYWNGCISKFCWNVDKYPATMSVSEIYNILHQQFCRTRKHFNDICKDYDRAQKAAVSNTQRPEKERNPEDQAKLQPRRRRWNVGTGMRQMFLLIRCAEKMFRETFDLFLHISVLIAFTKTFQNFYYRKSSMFLVTPLDIPKALAVFDGFFWENHRILPIIRITPLDHVRMIAQYFKAFWHNYRMQRVTLSAMIKCSRDPLTWERHFILNGIRLIPERFPFPSLENALLLSKTDSRPYPFFIASVNFMSRL